MASKQTIQNQIQKLSEQFKANPYEVEGWYFEEDLGEQATSIDHRANQIRLGFLKSVEESEAYHKVYPSSEFNYLGEDYLEFIKPAPLLPYT